MFLDLKVLVSFPANSDDSWTAQNEIQSLWCGFHHCHSGGVNVTGFLCGQVLVDDLGSLTIFEAVNFDINSDDDVAEGLYVYLQQSK